MWETLKSNQPNSILSLEYEEFASINVEKIQKGSLYEYIVDINIYNLLEDSIVTYSMKELEKSLEFIKEKIEDLYNSYDSYSDIELNEWIDNFQDEIEEY